MKIYKHNEKCNACGVRIREERERLGLSQERLAAKMQLQGCNLNQKAISRIETGARIVTDYELYAFGKFFCVPMQSLLTIE